MKRHASPIAIALLTCDRYDYTARTLQTLAAQNDLSRFRLVHVDDCSTDPRVVPLVQSYGFETVLRQRERRGWRISRYTLLWKSARRAPWILFLENDIESLRPFPWKLFDHIRTLPAIYCLRLYGQFKDRARREPCLTTHKRLDHQPVEWRRLKGAPEKTEVGLIHWSAQPCVTRIGELMSLHKTGVEPMGLTARVTSNVMAHIGVERTAPLVAPLEVAC